MWSHPDWYLPVHFLFFCTWKNIVGWWKVCARTTYKLHVYCVIQKLHYSAEKGHYFLLIGNQYGRSLVLTDRYAKLYCRSPGIFCKIIQNISLSELSHEYENNHLWRNGPVRIPLGKITRLRCKHKWIPMKNDTDWQGIFRYVDRQKSISN